MAHNSLVFNNRFTVLLLTLIAFLLVPSFLFDSFFKALAFTLALSLLFIQSVYVVILKKRFLYFGLITGTVILTIIWLSFFMDFGPAVRIIMDILLIMFFVFIIVILLKFLFQSKEVTVDFILISIIIYLLMGIIGGFIFSLLDEIYPNILSVPSEEMNNIMDFMYYSFVTMTTLGYGDISPVIPQSRVIAVLLAVIGQFYLAVIVALIVGKFVTKIKN